MPLPQPALPRRCLRLLRSQRAPPALRGRCPRQALVVARGLRRLAVLRSLQLPGGHLPLAGLDAVGERLDHQVARANRVVVAGDHVVRLVGVTVRVDERDHRQVEALCLTHGELLLAQVDDEDRVRLAAHVGDTAEVRFELLELGLHRDALLRREQVELSLGLERPQLMKTLDAVGDRAPVGQQPTEPAVVDVRHADAARLVANGVLRLLLGADEEHGAVALRDRLGEVVRLVQKLLRLGEVDDVDATALGEDEALHLRVPAAGLVAEMDAGLQQFLHGNDGHGSPFLRFGLRCSGEARWQPNELRPPATEVFPPVEGTWTSAW